MQSSKNALTLEEAARIVKCYDEAIPGSIIYLNMGNFTEYLARCRGFLEGFKVKVKEAEALIHALRTLWCDSKRDPESGFVDIKYLDQFESLVQKYQSTKDATNEGSNCRACGVWVSKIYGGTVFSRCEECWDTKDAEREEK